MEKKIKEGFKVGRENIFKEPSNVKNKVALLFKATAEETLNRQCAK